VITATRKRRPAETDIQRKPGVCPEAKRGENKSSKFWLSIMNGMRKSRTAEPEGNRGVKDIFTACTDGLTGFPEAIAAAFPKTEIHRCVIHRIRNSTKYVSYKDIKALMADPGRVYGALNEEEALSELDSFDSKQSGKYPKIAESWRTHWAELSTYFKYPREVRKLICTTNATEGFNRQLRKVTKSKSVFPTDDSLLKMPYTVFYLNSDPYYGSDS
jgi:transposase-like protein